ncbi:MAG TPA: DUF3090 family protein [Candidatus Acidoferrales bacterium]|nr:DUF3090 family protein [Candidatus Acidoferrales bacterium]
MPPRIFRFDAPDRFTTGTVGEPGNRTFFLQARSGPRVVSVVVEKEQVAVLADRMGQLLEEMRTRGVDVPLELPEGSRDTTPLDEPLVEQFRVGSMVLTWDGEEREIVVEARAQVEEGEEAADDADDDDDATDGPDVLQVRMPAEAARVFVDRALRVVSAGRPPCPFCGLPLNPEGHICPRRNGHIH